MVSTKYILWVFWTKVFQIVFYFPVGNEFNFNEFQLMYLTQVNFCMTPQTICGKINVFTGSCVVHSVISNIKLFWQKFKWILYTLDISTKPTWLSIIKVVANAVITYFLLLIFLTLSVICVFICGNLKKRFEIRDFQFQSIVWWFFQILN